MGVSSGVVRLERRGEYIGYKGWVACRGRESRCSRGSGRGWLSESTAGDCVGPG